MSSFKKNIFFLILLILILILGGGGYYVYQNHDQLLTQVAERYLNQATYEFFNGSLRLRGMNVDRNFHLNVAKIEGALVTEKGLFPFELEDFRSGESLVHLFRNRPVTFQFNRLRPQGSKSAGAHSRLVYDPESPGYFNLNTEIEELHLEELVGLNPENLAGSYGKITGDLFMAATMDFEKQNFKIDIYSLGTQSEPGGSLQARFFNILLPYLPVNQKTLIEQRLGSKEIVAYQRADLHAEFLSKEKMKLLLHILIPEYNLNLNLNMDIRLEEGNSFFQFAQLLGLVKVQVS